MIRQFYLENASGQKYHFDYRTGCLITNISGLGFQKEFTYLPYDQFFDRVDESFPMTDIQATLVFLNGYLGYSEFLDYLKLGDQHMVLYYRGNDESYCHVEIKSLSKGELKSGGLQSDITLQKKSLWLKSQALQVDVNVVNQGKVYPYHYSYTYSVSFEGKAKIENRGVIPAPLIIEITGAVLDPEVIISKDGVVVTTMRLYVESSDGTIHVSALPTNQHIYQTLNGLTNSIYDKQDFTVDNFLFLPPGEFDLEFKPGVSSATTCQVSIIEGFLGA